MEHLARGKPLIVQNTENDYAQWYVLFLLSANIIDIKIILTKWCLILAINIRGQKLYHSATLLIRYGCIIWVQCKSLVLPFHSRKGNLLQALRVFDSVVIIILALWGWFRHDVLPVTCCEHGPPSIATVHFWKFPIATNILFNLIPFNPIKQVFRFHGNYSFVSLGNQYLATVRFP